MNIQPLNVGDRVRSVINGQSAHVLKVEGERVTVRIEQDDTLWAGTWTAWYYVASNGKHSTGPQYV